MIVKVDLAKEGWFSKLVQTSLYLSEIVQIGLNLSEIVQTCPNLFIWPLEITKTPALNYWKNHYDFFPLLYFFISIFLGEPDDNNAGDEDEILVDGISRPRNSDSRNGEGLIKLRQFATVPHLPRNVQSRGIFYYYLQFNSYEISSICIH